MRARSDWAISAVADLIAQFNPAISAIIAILDRFKGLQKLRSGGDLKADEKHDIHDLLRAYAKARSLLGLKQVPLIVLIDDASMASAELLSLVNALILRPEPDLYNKSNSDQSYGSEEDYLVSQIDEVPPLPTMLIAATWPESSPAAKTAPAAQWIRSFRKLDLQAALCLTRNFNSQEAAHLLSNPHSNLLAETGEKLLLHTASQSVAEQVNPLALVGALGEIQAHRDPFTGSVDIQSIDLEHLPSTAAQVMASRLSRTREHTWGQATIIITKMIAAAGGIAPWELIKLLAERHEEVETAVFEILNDERLAAFSAEVPQETLPLNLVRIEPELSDFFHDEGISEDARMRLANAIRDLLQIWTRELEKERYCSTYEWEIRQNIMRSLAVYAHEVLPPESHSALIRALAEPDFVGSTVGSSPEEQAAIYLFTKGQVHDSFDDIIDGALRLLPSPLGWHAITFLMREAEFDFTDTMLAQTVDIVQRNGESAEGRRLLTKLLLLAGDIERAVGIAGSVERYDSAVVPPVVQDLLRRGRHDDALGLLSKFPDNGNACISAAKILNRHGHQEAAMRRLEPLAYSNWLVAGSYSDLLARAQRTDEARKLLGFWAERKAPAALRYSRLLMKQGDRASAIKVLRKYADDDPELRLELARVHWRNGDYLAAVTSVGSCPPEYKGTASTVASFFNNIGDRGLRFQADGTDLRVVEDVISEEISEDTARIDSAGKEIMSIGGRGDMDRFLRGARDLTSEELLDRHSVNARNNSWLAQGLAAVLIQRSDYGQARDVLLYHSKHAGAACTLAGLEIQINGVEGLESARSLLEQLTVKSAPVQGRLAAVDAVTGAVERSGARLEDLAPSEMGYGVIAVFALLGSVPSLEARAWKELNSIPTKPKLTQLVRMMSAGRALAIVRGYGKPEFDIEQMCNSWWEDESVRSSVVRICEGVAYAYGRDRTSVSPQLRPYQILSIVECMRCLGRKNEMLEDALVDQLRLWHRRADAKLRQSFAEWSAFSNLVGRIVS